MIIFPQISLQHLVFRPKIQFFPHSKFVLGAMLRSHSPEFRPGQAWQPDAASPIAQQAAFQGRGHEPGNPVFGGQNQFGHQMPQAGMFGQGRGMFGQGNHGQPQISNRLGRSQIHPVDLWHGWQSESDAMSQHGGYMQSAAGSSEPWLFSDGQNDYDGFFEKGVTEEDPLWLKKTESHSETQKFEITDIDLF